MLVVEDDRGIATQLVRGLSRNGYAVEHVTTGGDALSRADPDVVLLDLGLPDGDGVDICRRLRQRSRVAIIVVTARGEEPERVLALDAGADDYLVKPFGLAELLARIRAVLRRVRPGGEVLRHGQLTVDLRTRKVNVQDREVALTPKAFDILALVRPDQGARRTCRGAAPQARRAGADRDGLRQGLPPRRGLGAWPAASSSRCSPLSGRCW